MLYTGLVCIIRSRGQPWKMRRQNQRLPVAPLDNACKCPCRKSSVSQGNGQLAHCVNELTRLQNSTWLPWLNSQSVRKINKRQRHVRIQRTYRNLCTSSPPAKIAHILKHSSKDMGNQTNCRLVYRPPIHVWCDLSSKRRFQLSAIHECQRS